MNNRASSVAIAQPYSADRLTVVVLTCNRKDELCRTLEKLQEMPERPPIVVVDNASNDGTAAYVTAQFPNIQVITTSANIGACARNLGAKQARSPYIAFCDDDTWWQAGSLASAVDILDTHPDIDVLNARVLVEAEEREDPACRAMEESPLGVFKGVGPRLIGFMAGAIVMRTATFLRAGGYWSNFFIGGEESLLALDILDEGGVIVYAPQLVVHHWPSSMRNHDERKRLLARNAIWTAFLRLPLHMAWRQTIETLLQMPDRRMRCSAALAAARGMPTVLAHRHVLHNETCKLLKCVWRAEEKIGPQQQPFHRN